MIQREVTHTGREDQLKADAYKAGFDAATQKINNEVRGKQQANEVHAAINEAHNKGVSTGANAVAEELVKNLNIGNQAGLGNDQQQPGQGQFTQEDVDHGAELLVNKQILDEDLDQMEQTHPGIKDAVLVAADNIRQANQQGGKPPVNQAGLNVG